MTTELNNAAAAPVAASKKIAKKANAKKLVAKKAAKKGGKAKASAKTPAAPRDPNKLGKPFVAILKAVSKTALSRAQISQRTGINSGFTGLLGHIDPAKREPQSLAARGFIKIEVREDGNYFSITAAGKKALEKHGK